MSSTLARKIRRIRLQKQLQWVPDSQSLELVPVNLSSQQYAERERAIRAAWKSRRLKNRTSAS